MRRIYNEYAYGPGPRTGCWWDDTLDMAPRPSLSESIRVDVAIVGAGFTGLSAALALAEQGTSVAVLEAQHVGWGASGRNGGFCCLGGAKSDDAELDRKFGKPARLEFRDAEKQAVAFVEQLIDRFNMQVDRHSDGETEFAHRPKDMEAMRRGVARLAENYGVDAQIIERDELAAHGMRGGDFHGAVTVPVGFGLNPRKYVAGLAKAAEAAGVRIFEKSAVNALTQKNQLWELSTEAGHVVADQVLIATNGYSSEDLPVGLKARYLPTQSNVLVTRPLTDAEISAQGWSTDQMSYDTRNMIHYFRLMPDRRFLFGMRGTMLSSPDAERRARAATRRHFEAMFPAWSGVESTHGWSGFVAIARNKVPYVGPLGEERGLWTSMCYHGNGVAMGSYCGKMAASMMLSGQCEERPAVMAKPLGVFPFGGLRRLVVPPLYVGLMLQDL